MHGLAIEILSARLSGRLSFKRVNCEKTKQSSVSISTPYDRAMFLVLEAVIRNLGVHLPTSLPLLVGMNLMPTAEQAPEVITNSDSDAAEQEVIRELNKINHDHIDGVSGSQISTGDLSQPAQCSDEIDAAQMSETQPQ